MYLKFPILPMNHVSFNTVPRNEILGFINFIFENLACEKPL